jgi:hypothetical protein
MLNFPSDENAESDKEITQTEAFNCLQQTFPFIKQNDLIVDSEYRLNILEVMELLIVVLRKEIYLRKYKEAMKDYKEKMKMEDNKKGKKSMKINRKKS